MSDTKIEWTDKTWNPITGCTPISEGCRNCYAKRMAQRLAGRYGYPADDPFRVTFHHDRLELPLRWKKPSKIFVNSMGDLFHGDVLTDNVYRVLDIIRRCPQHTFQILTKRPERAKTVLFNIGRRHLETIRLPNLWLGVTVENAKYTDRIDILRTIPAAVRFISFEPLLGDVGKLNLEGIHWVIVGGETGTGARPMNADWARSIRDQCAADGVPFFFKKTGTPLGNQEYLDNTWYREFPEVTEQDG